MSSIDAISALGAIEATSTNDVATPTPPQNPGAILDGEAFLKLLVAQLKNQDPSSPADTSQMLTQSAQLSMVERLNEISASLTESTTMNRMALAGSMIGRDVTFLDETGELVTAPVEAVRFEAGEFVLHAGGFSVPVDAVLEVRDAAFPLAPLSHDPASSADATDGETQTDVATPADAADATDGENQTDVTAPADAADPAIPADPADGGGVPPS